MASYVKLWTTLLDDPEFLSLSMAQRGAYVQLILACKNGRDDGMVSYRDGTALGSAWGCDRKTSGKTLGILAEKSLCSYSKNDGGVITIRLPNYKRWQDMTVEKVREKRRKIPAKIPPLRPDQIRADKTRPDKSKPEQSSGKKPEPSKRKIPDTDHGRLIQYWSNLYEERFEAKYDFKGGQDGSIIKRLLKTFGFEKCCDMMETFFNSDDEFLRKAGKTIGVLSSQSNKLIQKIVLADDPLSKFSPAAQKTIENARQILEKDAQNARE